MEFIKNIFEILEKYDSYLLKGLGYTMLIALVGTVIGLAIGLIAGIIRTIPKSKDKAVAVLQKCVDILINVYVEVFRGTPMMVQALVIYWGFAFLTDSSLDLIPAGIFIVSINTGAYMTEIVRGGIISIDKGQFEAAYSCGMNHFQAMWHVVIPQLMKNILPSISNEFVINIKDTSVLNVIGVYELFYQAKTILATRWDLNSVFGVYLIVCVMYLTMTFSITRLLRLAEKKLTGSKNYTICGSQSDPNAEIHIKEGQ